MTGEYGFRVLDEGRNEVVARATSFEEAKAAAIEALEARPGHRLAVQGWNGAAWATRWTVGGFA